MGNTGLMMLMSDGVIGMTSNGQATIEIGVEGGTGLLIKR